jgi:hypothetical protein
VGKENEPVPEVNTGNPLCGSSWVGQKMSMRGLRLDGSTLVSKGGLIHFSVKAQDVHRNKKGPNGNPAKSLIFLKLAMGFEPATC